MIDDLMWQSRVDIRAELITRDCRCKLLRGETVFLRNAPADPVTRGPADVALEIIRNEKTQRVLASSDQEEAGALLHQAVIDAVETTLSNLAADICAAAEKLERKEVMRKAGKIFNEEKVLYFASQEQSFHVQPGEDRDTDCSRIVRHLVSRGCLELEEEGHGGRFYTITDKGRATLLKMQIEWRRNHNKDTSAHEAELKQIEVQS